MNESKTNLAEQLRRESHRICSLILNSDLPWIDITFEIERMRELCLAQAPEKADLFDAIYVSRFRRLWEQWRTHAGEAAGTPEEHSLNWLRPREWVPGEDDDEWGAFA